MSMSIGKFTVLNTLGRGANSSVLHIRRQADLKEYALKVIPISEPEDRKFLEQAKHEFRVGQMLGHNNIIKIYAFETERNWFFSVKKAHLLIEYVAGKAMDEIPAVPLPKLLPIMSDVTGALMHMHRRGVLHGDLKPNNLLLGRGNKVKVIDLGLSWIKDEPKNRIQGTPEYMAPETAAKKIVTEQSDIFNFGATFYRLATYTTPPSVIVEGQRLKESEWKRFLKPVQECNAAAPKDVCDFIHRCMEYQPDKRFERMSDVKDELDQLTERYGEIDE